MEQFLYLSELFDLYGALLTERQQRCLELHLYEDFSLSEIGEGAFDLFPVRSFAVDPENETVRAGQVEQGRRPHSL